jgi:hypothetical protein
MSCSQGDMEAIATLTSLHSLRLEVPDQQWISSLSALCSLSELHLRLPGTAFPSVAVGIVLCSLTCLTSLSLEVDQECDEDEHSHAVFWDALVRLPQLVQLSLTGSCWTELPAYMSSLTKLTFLRVGHAGDVWDAYVVDFPVGELLQLQVLNISSFACVTLPASISRLTKLRAHTVANIANSSVLMHLSTLQLLSTAALPSQLSDLKALRWLEVTNRFDDALTALPGSCSSLSALERLKLYSSLDYFPDICNLSRLTLLIVSHAATDELPDSLPSWRNCTLEGLA